MLDEPRIVVAEPIGELDLTERVLQEVVLASLAPGTGQLMLVEDAELHACAPWPAPIRGRRRVQRTGGQCRGQARRRTCGESPARKVHAYWPMNFVNSSGAA